MKQLLPGQQKFIEDNSYYLQNNDFKSFWQILCKDVSLRVRLSDFTQFFLDCGITAEELIQDIPLIPHGMFRETSIKSIDIPESIKYIEDVAFFGCADLQKVTFPDTSINVWGEATFGECVSLTSIDMKHLSATSPGMFRYCDHLKKIVFSSSQDELSSEVCSSCDRLTDVVIPEGVKIIREHAFIDCISLKHINIPSTVFSIQHGAFSGCSRLRTAVLPKRFKNDDLQPLGIDEDVNVTFI